MVPIEFICERCDGVAVIREAWAEWDVPRQDWVLATVFDRGFCLTCYRSSNLVGRPVEQG
jgi:hypothetical protein